MVSTLELYRRIGNRQTVAHRWNDLSDDDRFHLMEIAERLRGAIDNGGDDKAIAKMLLNELELRKES